MTRESILEWTRRRPFVPFVLRVSNGKEYIIRHPEMVMPTFDTVIVGIPDHEGSDEPLINRISMVSILHIVEIVPYREQQQKQSA